MALKATIYKATVNVADLDRNQFLDASLTLARHPSETQERMMLRLLAWLKYADERLQFTRGLCADDEPEAWLRNDHLGIDLWIELGLPDERRIKKACTQAAEVALFAYNSRAAQIWWQQNAPTSERQANSTAITEQMCAVCQSFRLVSGRRAAGESERLCRSYHDAAGNDSGWCYLVIG
ncbi:hypothetical protein EIMP300_78770 [Escherichia coli]|uniref:YaeQ family protein n=1 Tax=Escherichia coli TaxID=562 RepID=A0A8S0G2W9_ECOLX|nr:hypothetical protein EIMP300_78770 [Escherichia coli]